MASYRSRFAGYDKGRAAKARARYKNAVAARKLQAKIAEQLKRGAGKGLEAMTAFLLARIKEALSVPAPRKRVLIGGNFVYRATTPAVPGAPPRKLSGRLRQSGTRMMLTPTVAVIGFNARGLPTKKRPAGFNYPAYHELGSGNVWGGGAHPFIKPTVEKYKNELKTIAGVAVKTELRAER